MLETFLVAFATLFATIGPPDVAVVFVALTTSKPSGERRRLALKATLIGSAILLFFAFLGKPLLTYLGISLAALRTAGGILLLLIAIDMVFARISGGTSTTAEENAEAAGRDDISVFPLATPLIAGPGAIGAAILLIADAQGDPLQIMIVTGALVAVLGHHAPAHDRCRPISETLRCDRRSCRVSRAGDPPCRSCRPVPV